MTQTTLSRITKAMIGRSVLFAGFNGVSYVGEIKAVKNGVATIDYTTPGSNPGPFTAYIDAKKDAARVTLYGVTERAAAMRVPDVRVGDGNTMQFTGNLPRRHLSSMAARQMAARAQHGEITHAMRVLGGY